MEHPPTERARVPDALPRKTIVLVGLMGAGKTSVGKRLAAALGLPFRDGDDEIEKSAGLTVPEIFELYGEERFREGERRVMQRLLDAPPHVLATGGGAFMAEATRQLCAESGITVWLKADVPVLMERVRKKTTRPLLNQPNPEQVLRDLLTAREPVYALADIVVESRDAPQSVAVAEIVAALEQHLSRKDTH